MEKMTKSEAIKKGYTRYGIEGRDFQSLNDIADMTDEDFNDPRGKLVLAGTEENHVSIDADSLRDMVTDNLMDNNEFMDDTDEIPNLLKSEINWDEMAEKINAVCKKRPYWFLTDIELVND